jgi:predicted acyl esterase
VDPSQRPNVGYLCMQIKLTDHDPATGVSRLIQDGIVRMRWRDNTTEPTYMKPGEVYEAPLSLWNTSYVFARGHQIRYSPSR